MNTARVLLITVLLIGACDDGGDASGIDASWPDGGSGMADAKPIVLPTDSGATTETLKPDTDSIDAGISQDVRPPDTGTTVDVRPPDTGTTADVRPPDTATSQIPLCTNIGANCYPSNPYPNVTPISPTQYYTGPYGETYACAICSIPVIGVPCWADFRSGCRNNILCLPPSSTQCPAGGRPRP